MDAWTLFRRTRVFLFAFLTILSLAWSGFFIAFAAKEWGSLSRTQRGVTIILFLLYASSGIWTYLMTVLLFHPRREFGRVGVLLLVQSVCSTVFTIFGPGLPHQTIAFNFFTIFIGCWIMTGLILVYAIVLCAMAVHPGLSQNMPFMEEEPPTPSIRGLNGGSHTSLIQGQLGGPAEVLAVESKRVSMVILPRLPADLGYKNTDASPQDRGSLSRNMSRRAIDHYARLESLHRPESQALPRFRSSESSSSLSESASSHGPNMALSSPSTPFRSTRSQTSYNLFSDAFERLGSPDSSHLSSTGWSSPSNLSIEIRSSSRSSLLGSLSSSPKPPVGIGSTTRLVAGSVAEPISPPRILSPRSAYGGNHAVQDRSYPRWRVSSVQNHSTESSPTFTSRIAVASLSTNVTPRRTVPSTGSIRPYQSADPHHELPSPARSPPRTVRFREPTAHVPPLAPAYDVPQELSPQISTLGRGDIPPANRVSSQVTYDNQGRASGTQGQGRPLEGFGGSDDAAMSDYPRWKRLAIEARMNHP
ncbi:hypothetical protein OF83DRAFT_1170933 [Amylostereum chailletii]|nr:hypothetical protein OF83DRAFT_1170933 [Amylostereum chailletii]